MTQQTSLILDIRRVSELATANPTVSLALGFLE